jgi:hypothetical protein
LRSLDCFTFSRGHAGLRCSGKSSQMKGL